MSKIMNKQVNNIYTERSKNIYQDTQDKADLFAVYKSLNVEQKKDACKQALHELQINTSYTEEGYNLTGLKLVKTTRN